MNKIFKITGWVLGLLGIVFGILAFVNGGGAIDILLRYTYVLFIAAVVIWIGLSIFISGRNNPKNLLKAPPWWSASRFWLSWHMCSHQEILHSMSRHSLPHSGSN